MRALGRPRAAAHGRPSPAEPRLPDPDPVFRFFNTTAGGHFFTVSPGERDAAAAIDGFSFEGVGFYAYPEIA